MSFIIKKSRTFDKWFSKLKNLKSKEAIIKRLIRLELGHFGDVKHIQDNIYEMRFFVGASYRIYYYHDEEKKQVVFLLCGGDKSTQNRDIQKALKIKKDYENE